ncbi:MAG: DUF2804 domain-containing protein [Clostridia bacterium]|nr:DUF2804 domain-containing protein [Clostridia bacterium]
MQKKIEAKMPLLDEMGNITEPGWATEQNWQYRRCDIKANTLRIKEWDYYLVYNKDFGVALTVADNGYMGMISASVINFKTKKEVTKSVMTFMPKGKFEMPESTDKGDVIFKNDKVEMRFINDGKIRKLRFNFANFERNNALTGEITLTKQPKESMVIATPFEKNKHFYYNQKIVGFEADGSIQIGTKKVEFLPKQTVGILDWGRGVWTYKNTWYWGAAAGKVDGADFGFNIGYGFGDTTNATENVVFYNGIAHKLNNVEFRIPVDPETNKEDYMSKWQFTSDDGRFEMEFEPIINRSSCASALIVKSVQNQVFGKFSGKVILDDDSVIEIKDFLGFAEKVKNRW